MREGRGREPQRGRQATIGTYRTVSIILGDTVLLCRGMGGALLYPAHDPMHIQVPPGAAAGGMASGGAPTAGALPKIKRITMKDKFLKSTAGISNAAEASRGQEGGGSNYADTG